MAILSAGSDINGCIAYIIQDLLDQPLFVTKNIFTIISQEDVWRGAAIK